VSLFSFFKFVDRFEKCVNNRGATSEEFSTFEMRKEFCSSLPSKHPDLRIDVFLLSPLLKSKSS
jgi:hypothetical protein